MRQFICILANLTWLLVATGCAQRQVSHDWQPAPLVHWADLTHEPMVPVRDEYRILPGRARGGTFPASLAVTRVSMERTGDANHPARPLLTSDPRNEFLQWNSALDDQFAVGEVFPVRQRALGGGRAVPTQILAAFRALNARLGLVYAVNELSETETEMIGILYDAVNAVELAVIHAQAKSVVPPETVEASEEPIDLWETDSRALVRARFENLLHACIHELIQRDGPVAIEAPVGWTPTAPVRPVIWPPRKSRDKP